MNKKNGDPFLFTFVVLARAPDPPKSEYSQGGLMLTRQHVLRGWGFGDGAPNLDRQRPMLFEECAQRLFDLEEMEYSLPTDEAQYVASTQSRFVKPEIVAVLGDVVRRMKMSRGTRAAIGRKGFDADLKTLANSSYEDFLEAMHIATPNETIVSAAHRSDMPRKIRTALRTLLLSTSAVPGTEGRRKSFVTTVTPTISCGVRQASSTLRILPTPTVQL